MMRVLGFVTGAAGVIGAMVVLLGAPAVQQVPVVEASQTVAATPAPISKSASDYDVPVPTAETLPIQSAATTIPAAAALQPEVPIDPAPEPVTGMASETSTPTNTAPPTTTATEIEALDGLEPAGDPPTKAPTDTAAQNLAGTPVTDALWHPFWQPFRSQIAANGFAARLTAITDIDYRVLRLKPGAYQVAFAYANDVERSTKLEQIESATGLRIAEASP